MKKSLIFFTFLLLFNASFFEPVIDTKNIEIDLTRLEGENIKISWSVNYENYDDIVVEILQIINEKIIRWLVLMVKSRCVVTQIM